MNFVILGNGALAVGTDAETAETVSGAAAPAVSADASPAVPATPVAADAAAGAVEAPKPDRRGDDRPFKARDRRWSKRSAILRHGFIFGGEAFDNVPCRVRDISKFGALIEISAETAAQLPEAFMLVFHANRVRSEAQCLLRWRQGDSVGVSFAGPVLTTLDRDRG